MALASLLRGRGAVKNDRSFYDVPVPRVSDAHLTARRDQILDAATGRFAENGFQATGMADVIQATGLSAGAVYRYFRSKDELIAAIVERVLGQAGQRFEQLLADDPTPDPAEAVGTAVDLIVSVAQAGPVDLTRVAVQAWAEALRNPAVATVAGNAYATMRGHFVEMARRAQHSGRLPSDGDPALLGAALFSLVLGFLLQRLLLGDIEPDGYVTAVRALLS
jgi:AcrR family transcriptional regulator